VSEVVIELPVDLGDEAQAFGAYVSRFMESRSAEAERLARFAEAPYFMMRSDPLCDRELKVITFQQPSAAKAFSRGWALERTRLGRSRTAA
jgi:hypothetical protein